MTIKNDEKIIYKSALRTVEETNASMLAIYETSLENIQGQIFDMQMQLLRGGTISAFKEERLNALYDAINIETEKIRQGQIKNITNGYIRNYERTYYLDAFAIEKEINRIIENRSVFLNFPAINRNAVIGSLNERVAGNTFVNRVTFIRDELRYKLRTAVSQTIVEGQTVAELAKRVSLLDDVYAASKARAMTVARTELLTGYSLGQEESVNEAEAAGVQFNYTWSSAFDKRTRPTHARADGQKALIIEGEPVFTVGGVKFSSPRVVSKFNTSTNTAREVVNCRCFRENSPFGIRPTVRVAQKRSGEWEEINGDITAAEWSAREYGIKLN